MINFLLKHKIFITVVLSLFFTFVIIGKIYAVSTDSEQHYVRSLNGNYCYEIHNYPKQIKHFVYFDSYEDCQSSLDIPKSMLVSTTTKPEVINLK